MSTATYSNVIKVATASTAAVAAVAAYYYFTWDPRWWWNRRKNKSTEVNVQQNWKKTLIKGYVHKDFEPVREEFIANFERRGELGAACCIFYKGEMVVNLWGGYREYGTKKEWENNTMSNVFSATKGISAIAMAILCSQGKINFDDKVCKHWPQFAQNGKEDITIRALVDHATGLAGPSPPISMEILRDKAKTIEFLAAVKPDWKTSYEKKGYMAILLGIYESCIMQMTDDKKRTIGEFLQEEIAEPLGLDGDIYIGLPDSITDERLTVLDAPNLFQMLFLQDTLPKGFMSSMLLNPSSYCSRAFFNPNLGNDGMLDYNRRDVKRLELAASNGHASAHALATIYNAVERAINTKCRINKLNLSNAALLEIQQGGKPQYDEVLKVETNMAGGFEKPGSLSEYGCDQRAFGTPGAGGQNAFADVESEMSFAYIMNRCGTYICDDPREFSCRVKAYQCIQKIRERNGEKKLPMKKLETMSTFLKSATDQFPELRML